MPLPAFAPMIMSAIKNPKVIAFGALVIFVVWHHYGHLITENNLLEDKVQLTEEIATAEKLADAEKRAKEHLQIELDIALGQIDDLNAIAARNHQKYLATQAELDKLRGDLSKQEADTKKAIEAILASPPPTTCEASIVYLRDSAGELKWPE